MPSGIVNRLPVICNRRVARLCLKEHRDKDSSFSKDHEGAVRQSLLLTCRQLKLHDFDVQDIVCCQVRRRAFA